MFGLNSPLKLPGREAAVKSGLTDNARDAWTIGYTPQLVTGIWVGNANNAPMPGATSTYTAAPIWHAFMEQALAGQPAQEFAVPSSVKFIQVCQTTGLLPERGCPKVVTEVFAADRVPAISNNANRAQSQQPTSTPVRTPTATPRLQPAVEPPQSAATPRNGDPPRNKERGRERRID